MCGLLLLDDSCSACQENFCFYGIGNSLLICVQFYIEVMCAFHLFLQNSSHCQQHVATQQGVNTTGHSRGCPQVQKTCMQQEC
jgi:hypothetical protein